MLKVKIKNFQSVADTSFDIDGFTVIVGKNNKGKSAIVRSIDAALSNRLGNNFIKWGKTETQVSLEKDGLDLTWTKGDAASYKVNDKSYTSLKGAVPQPILDAGFRKLEIADEKLNPLVAHQFEELFLINRSGPFVTETLSTLYELNVINDADILCQKKLRASKSLLKTRQSDADVLIEKLETFKGLDDLKIKIEKIRGLQEKSDSLNKEILEIEAISEQLKAQLILVNKLKNLQNIKIPSVKKVTNLVTDVQWLIQALLEYTDLTRLVQIYSNLDRITIPSTESANQLLTKYQWLVLATVNFQTLNQRVSVLKEVSTITVPVTKKAGELIQEVQAISKLTNDLRQILISCEKCKKTLVDLKNLNSIVEKLKVVESQIKVFSELTEMTGVLIPLAQSVKELKAQNQTAKTDLELAQQELGEFKICPLCKNSLTPEHNHA